MWPKNPNLKEMYSMYQEGYSLAAVGDHFGRSRQAVFGLFKWHGLPTRTTKKLPCVFFNGSKYTMRNTGYFGKTDGERTLLHRDMWEAANGKIPNGWDIHHVDEDKTNNALSNFQCLPKGEHSRQHQLNKKGKEKCGA